MFKKILVGLLFSFQLFAKEVILDVRTPEEFKGDHVMGALNVDVKSPDFKSQISKMDKADSYKVYCKSGGRAEKAVSTMREMGFKNLQNLGGLEDAKKQIYVK
jgi:phage shock protein E